MLLKLPIILSRNSIYLDPLILFPVQSISLITILYSYVKKYNISKSKKDLWFSQFIAKGIFSKLCCYGYELYCIVVFSLSKDYECKRLCFDSIEVIYKNKFCVDCISVWLNIELLFLILFASYYSQNFCSIMCTCLERLNFQTILSNHMHNYIKNIFENLALAT